MGFFFLLLYITVSYIFPGEIIPSLIPYHLTYWIGLGGLAVSFILVLTRRGAPLRSIQLYLLLGFFGILMISWVIADRWLGAIPEAVRQFAPSLTMFVMTICCVDSLRKLKWASNLVVMLSLVILAQGIAAYHFGINGKTFLFDVNARTEYATDADSEDDRPTEAAAGNSDEEGASQVKRIRGLGILHDPNDLALGFVVALPLIRIGTSASKLRKCLFVYLPFIALSYGVFLTHSRGGTLGALAILMLLFGRRFGWYRAGILVAVLAAGATAIDIGGGRKFSAADDSAAGRIEAWSEGLQMLKSQPLTGVGFRQFTEHNPLTAHNSFVLCFAETGLIGYSLWLGLLGITVFNLQKLKQISKDDPTNSEIASLATHLQCALFGFMAAAFFLSRTYVPLLYMLIGLCSALVLVARQVEIRLSLPSWPKVFTAVAASEVASVILIYIICQLQVVT
jgi:hypothetical protein